VPGARGRLPLRYARDLRPLAAGSARPNSPGTFLIHLRDAGKECPRPVRGTPRIASGPRYRAERSCARLRVTAPRGPPGRRRGRPPPALPPPPPRPPPPPPRPGRPPAAGAEGGGGGGGEGGSAPGPGPPRRRSHER